LSQDTKERKESLFNKQYRENWISLCKTMKVDLYLAPCAKINSKWSKDFNLISGTTKLLEENRQKTP
jgi:hypothetical protein